TICHPHCCPHLPNYLAFEAQLASALRYNSWCLHSSWLQTCEPDQPWRYHMLATGALPESLSTWLLSVTHYLRCQLLLRHCRGLYARKPELQQPDLVRCPESCYGRSYLLALHMSNRHNRNPVLCSPMY